MMPVGQGRSAPNNDPFLPDPAGRLSLMSGPWASLLGGFFVISGSLKIYLLNILMVVLAVLMIALTIYSLATSFSGTFLSMIILDDD